MAKKKETVQPAEEPQQFTAASEAAPQEHAPRPKAFKVRATKMGYLNNERKRIGDVFLVTEKQYSDRWMDRVDSNTRTNKSSSRIALAREQEKIRQRQSDGVPEESDGPTGDAEVI